LIKRDSSLRIMEIQCTYGKYKFCNREFYRCLVKAQYIPANQELKFIGQLIDGTTNMDVIHVEFNRCTVTKVPQGLTKIFPNLRILEIWNSNLTKICKNDLVEYKNLKELKCSLNEIEILPSRLFEDFKNLEWISFYKNKLKVIVPNIFDGLNNLKYVDFQYNPNYGKFYSFYTDNKQNAILNEFKAELHLKYKQHSELYAEYLQQENEQLTLKLQTGFFGDLKAWTEDETTKDFKIIIEGHEFPVHKFLLAARSPFLAEILKNNPEVENLNLVDISVEIFEIIFKFLYTDEHPGDKGTNFMHLFAAAGMLKIKELKNFAALKIFNQLNKENALEVFKLSSKYEHDELKQEAFNILKKAHSMNLGTNP